MNEDADLREWQADWLAQAPPPGLELERRVRRQGARLRWMLAGELALSLLLAGGSAALAAYAREPELVAWAGAVWLFVGAAQGFSVWNWRGLGRDSAATTKAFLELSRARCRAYLRACRFGLGLLAAETLVVGVWLGSGLWTGWAGLVFLGLVLSLLTGLLVIRSRKREELTRLEIVADEVSGLS